MVDDLTKKLIISAQEKIKVVKNERVLEVTLTRKKIHWRIKRQH